MIYEYPDESQPLRQGDIFYPLPMTLIDLDKLVIVSEEKLEENNWKSIQKQQKSVVSIPVKPVWGVIASQDCDVSRAPLVSLFEIGKLEDVTRLTLPTSPKRWLNLITQHSRLNAKWFYLPSDDRIGFSERMAISFETVFQIPRSNLEKYVSELRRGRLNAIAIEHYRESIAYYFRRYAYDEWYSLTKEEFDKYNEEKGPVEPFDWQK